MNYIVKILQYLDELVTTDSGKSSKSFIAVWGVAMSTLIILWYLTMKTIEMFTTYVLNSNWTDFVAVLGSISVFILASVYGKVKGEQSYYSSLDNSESNNISLNKEDGVG